MYQTKHNSYLQIKKPFIPSLNLHIHISDSNVTSSVICFPVDGRLEAGFRGQEVVMRVSSLVYG